MISSKIKSIYMMLILPVLIFSLMGHKQAIDPNSLIGAITYGDIKKVKQYFHSKKTTKDDKFSALASAIIANKIVITKYLINNGVKFYLQDFTYSEDLSHEMIDLLLRHANHEEKSYFYSRTIYNHPAKIRDNKNNNINYILFKLSKDRDFVENAKDKYRIEVLAKASEYNFNKICELFIINKKPIKLKSSEKMLSVFSNSLKRNQLRFIKELLKKYKSYLNYKLTVHSFEINNPQVFSKYNKGKLEVYFTPLALAIDRNNLEMVKLLIKNGAKVKQPFIIKVPLKNDKRVKRNYSLIKFAQKIGNKDIIKLLKKHGA